MNKVKPETICHSHKCDKCKKDLVGSYEWVGYILVVLFVIFMLMLPSKTQKIDVTSHCYKEFIGEEESTGNSAKKRIFFDCGEDWILTSYK